MEYLYLSTALSQLPGLARQLLSSNPSQQERTVKKHFVLACLVALAVPFSASAAAFHHHIRGNEMAVVGFGAAALVGAVGYLIVRRRHSA